MNTVSSSDKVFIDDLTRIVKAKLKNEKFGVSELSQEFGKSRSYIHRRLKAITNESVSQFINRIRLEKATELLHKSELTVSEISYDVGFSSPAYFCRCFHKYYGFSPGEEKKRFANEVEKNSLPRETGRIPEAKPVKTKYKRFVIGAFICLLVIICGVMAYNLLENDGILQTKNNDLSIIVLPFQNFSENTANAFFAEGIREDILNNLYWITALRVISRTSAEQFRGSKLTAREIAKKMNVHYVLEGSVRREKEKVRITVQLIDATKREDHLWSSNFDRELDDIIGVQDEIALQVASKLKAVLSENERQKIEKRSTQNSKAYEYLLQARFLHHKSTSELRNGFDKSGVENCLKYYEMAIAEDPNFAEAYAELALANFNLTAWKFIPSNKGFLKARELSLKALEIDHECAVAHAVLAAFNIWGIRNFEVGKKEYETAIRLNPNFATARQGYAQFLMITGPIEEARRQVNHAINLEPNFWVVQNLNSWIYYFEGKYKKALEACTIARDFNPHFSSNHWLFVINYAKLGEGQKMKEQLQYIAKRYSKSDNYTEAIQQAYDNGGIEGLFYWLIDVNKNNPIEVEGMNGHPFFIAWWNAILGNEEEAILGLEEVVQSKTKLWHYFNLIATNPDFNKYQNNPRFQKVVDQVGLTPYLYQQKN